MLRSIWEQHKLSRFLQKGWDTTFASASSKFSEEFWHPSGFEQVGCVLQDFCLLGRMGFGEGDVKGTSLLDQLLEWLPTGSEPPGRLKAKS